MRVKPAPRNFAGGELAPWMDGLYTELTQKGARRLENFIVKKQGAIVRRPGTYYFNEGADLIDHGDCESTEAPHIRDDGSFVSNATFARDNGQAHEGTYSFKHTITATGTNSYAFLCDGTDTDDLHELVAGKTYELSGYVYVPTSGGTALNEVNIQVQVFYTGAWTGVVSGNPSEKDTWEKLTTGQFTIPSTATGIKVRIYISTAASNGEYVYWDNIRLIPIDEHPILVPCQIDNDNIYVLEVGQENIRFYDALNHVQISLAASAYEVTSPWSTGELTDLRWTYIPNEKAMYFAHPKHALQKLEWTSDSNWSLD